MKKTELMLLTLLTLAMLFAGGCTNSGEVDDVSTISPELNSPPQETQKPPTPSPDENMEKLSLVGGAPDESILIADYATEELLAQYESYEEFTESENAEYQVKLLFKMTDAVTDVRFLMIYTDITAEDYVLPYSVYKILYSKDEITPEKPLVVGTVFEGSHPTRAISFVDKDGITRYYAVNLSGEDGSLVLLELVPRFKNN